MRISNSRAILAVLAAGILSVSSGCSNAFSTSQTRVRTWQLDDHSTVVFREEKVRNRALSDSRRNFNRDVMTIETVGESEPEVSVIIQGDVPSTAPIKFDDYAMIEFRSDENRRAVWAVDKRENKRMWSIIRPQKDPAASPDQPPPEMTAISGVPLKEITAGAGKS